MRHLPAGILFLAACLHGYHAPAQSNLVIFTFSGLAGVTGNTDSTGTNASFQYPCGISVDKAGYVYLGDSGNQTVRKISPAGVVTTLAGVPGKAGTNDGDALQAHFSSPQATAVNPDGTLLYVADTGNNTIRKLVASGTNWTVSTFAGAAGQAGTNEGTGNTARFNSPRSVALATNGNLYVADANNATIRLVTPAGVVTTLAGSAGKTGSANGTGGSARFNQPRYVAVDDATNVYVADWNSFTVRKITAAGVVSTPAGLAGSSGSSDGVGSVAHFNSPRGVAVDRAGNVYVADYYNSTIRKISAGATVSTIAGRVGGTGSADGYYTNATFNVPFALYADPSGQQLYIVDNNNHTLRKGILDNGQPLVIAEPQLLQVPVETNFTLAPVISNAVPTSYQWTFNGTNFPNATNASLTISHAQFTDSGDYGLVAANLSGSSTNPVATVQVVPFIITAQPQNIVAPMGANTNFVFSVASALPLVYQWRFNSTALGYATSASLPLLDIQGTNAGYYSVIISNVYGSATSATASLSVLGAPTYFLTGGSRPQYTNYQYVATVAGLSGQGAVVIQTSTNLINWSPMLTNPAGFGQFQFTDSQATNYPRRFYRAATPGVP